MIIKWLKKRKEKKELERVKKLIRENPLRPVRAVSNPITIVTVSASRQLDKAEQREFVEHNPYVCSYITEGLARELANEMIEKQLIEWETEVDSMGGATVYARVRVCNKPKSYGYRTKQTFIDEFPLSGE